MSGEDERERLVGAVVSKAKQVARLAADYWQTSGAESIYLENKLDAAEAQLNEACEAVLAALREREPGDGLPPVFRQELSEGFCWTVQWGAEESAWALGAINPKTGEHVFHSYLPEPQPEREPDLRMALEESLKLQGHYASLLNAYDGGLRRQFVSVEEWVARLCEVGTPPQDQTPQPQEEPQGNG